MSMSDVFENDVLKLIFHGTPIASIADNAASAPLTQFYMGLHSADPGEGGNQSTNEVSYPGYVRASIARSPAGWTINGNQVSPTSVIEWMEASGAVSITATHITIGTASSSNGKVILRGALTPTIPINQNTIPRLRTTSVITAD